MFANAITNVETEEPVAALTFDDGPHPDYTPSLLKKFSKRMTRERLSFFSVNWRANFQR